MLGTLTVTTDTIRRPVTESRNGSRRRSVRLTRRGDKIGSMGSEVLTPDARRCSDQGQSNSEWEGRRGPEGDLVGMAGGTGRTDDAVHHRRARLSPYARPSHVSPSR
ncbi:hypothetical protein GCM10010440_14820 [Kitasatospora cinereorecta]